MPLKTKIFFPAFKRKQFKSSQLDPVKSSKGKFNQTRNKYIYKDILKPGFAVLCLQICFVLKRDETRSVDTTLIFG